MAAREFGEMQFYTIFATEKNSLSPFEKQHKAYVILMVALCCYVKGNTLNVHYDGKVGQLIIGFS